MKLLRFPTRWRERPPTLQAGQSGAELCRRRSALSPSSQPRRPTASVRAGGSTKGAAPAAHASPRGWVSPAEGSQAQRAGCRLRAATGVEDLRVGRAAVPRGAKRGRRCGPLRAEERRVLRAPRPPEGGQEVSPGPLPPRDVRSRAENCGVTAASEHGTTEAGNLRPAALLWLRAVAARRWQLPPPLLRARAAGVPPPQSSGRVVCNIRKGISYREAIQKSI